MVVLIIPVGYTQILSFFANHTLATPKITDAMVPFLVLAIIKAKPPKKAIKDTVEA